jgi:hypothetical protein
MGVHLPFASAPVPSKRVRIASRRAQEAVESERLQARLSSGATADARQGLEASGVHTAAWYPQMLDHILHACIPAACK